MTGKPIQYSDLFVESRRPTKAAGQPYNDADAQVLVQEWRDSLFQYDKRAQDGENYADIIGRADQALRFLEDIDADSIVVVTHGYFMRTMIARVLLGSQLSPTIYCEFQDHIWMENTGITIMIHDTRRDPIWRLWMYNDHAHLGE